MDKTPNPSADFLESVVEKFIEKLEGTTHVYLLSYFVSQSHWQLSEGHYGNVEVAANREITSFEQITKLQDFVLKKENETTGTRKDGGEYWVRATIISFQKLRTEREEVRP